MNSILLAFAMFTRLPMPKLDWNEKNMRYIMAAFPLVGVAAGMMAAGWNWVCLALDVGAFLRGVGFALAPLVLTGGIHMDGFCDTTDALASHGDIETKRRILKDPHIGPFAAFLASAYLLAYAAVAGELAASWRTVWCFAALFVLNRALAGVVLLSQPAAVGSSLGKSFHDAAAKKTSLILLAAFLAAAAAVMIGCGGLAGGVALAGCLGWTAWYKRIALREFGGVTGDLSGWYLQWCELAGLFLLVMVGKIA